MNGIWFFLIHFTACWFCIESTVQQPCFPFHCTWHFLSGWGSTPTQACFDTFLNRLLNPLPPLIILLCLCFYCGQTLAERAQSGNRWQRFTPPCAHVLSDWMHRLICISHQIIVLMPIRSITSGEHEDITTPTYCKWWRRFHLTR